MPIIKCGNIFEAKFGTGKEPRIEVALGGLPVTFSQIRPHRTIAKEDKYRLSLQLNEEQFNEVHAAMLEALEALNKAGSYGATKKQLEEVLSRAVGPSTVHEGTFRFYGSRGMGYPSKESGEMEPINLPVYDGVISEDTKIAGGVSLGAGSVVRSTFIISLFKSGKQVLLNINPSKIVIVKKVEPPKRESLSHDGLDDTMDAYDF